MFFRLGDLLQPKYWLLSLILGVFWSISRLPYASQIQFGKGLGRLIFRYWRKPSQVIKTNIQLCFPQLSVDECRAMSRASSIELGVAIAETFLVWFRDHRVFLKNRYVIEGENNLEQAMSQSKGIIFLACHHGCVDVNAAMMASVERGTRKFIATYKRTDDFVNRFLRYVRCRYCDDLVSATDQRSIVRHLKKGNIIWYAPDIDVANNKSVFSNFMGIKASTTTAISRLAKVTGAIVVPVGHYRVSDKPEYKIKVFPGLAQFPSQDSERDAEVVNQSVEKIIEPDPAAYWWVIKRFRHRPEGEKGLY